MVSRSRKRRSAPKLPSRDDETIDDLLTAHAGDVNELKYESRNEFGSGAEGDKEKVYQKAYQILTDDSADTSGSSGSSVSSGSSGASGGRRPPDLPVSRGRGPIKIP